MKALTLAAAAAVAYAAGRRRGECAGYHRAQVDTATAVRDAWEQGAQAVNDAFRALGAQDRAALARLIAQRDAAARGLQ